MEFATSLAEFGTHYALDLSIPSRNSRVLAERLHLAGGRAVCLRLPSNAHCCTLGSSCTQCRSREGRFGDFLQPRRTSLAHSLRPRFHRSQIRRRGAAIHSGHRAKWKSPDLPPTCNRRGSSGTGCRTLPNRRALPHSGDIDRRARLAELQWNPRSRRSQEHSRRHQGFVRVPGLRSASGTRKHRLGCYRREGERDHKRRQYFRHALAARHPCSQRGWRHHPHRSRRFRCPGYYAIRANRGEGSAKQPGNFHADRRSSHQGRTARRLAPMLGFRHHPDRASSVAQSQPGRIDRIRCVATGSQRSESRGSISRRSRSATFGRPPLGSGDQRRRSTNSRTFGHRQNSNSMKYNHWQMNSPTTRRTLMNLRTLLYSILFSFGLLSLPASAAWGPFVAVGTNTVNSDLSCTPLTGGKAVCAARSFTNTVLVNQYNGTAWGAWKSLAGTITSAPSCAPDGKAQIICAARAADGGMVYSIYNGTAWSAEGKLAGALASGLSCATLGGGRVLCAARSAAGGLASTIYSGTAWSAFALQAAKTTTPPSCAGDDAGRVVCMMQDTASTEIANRYNGSSWDGFINTGGQGSGEPSCSNFGSAGQVVCFARGTNTSLFGNRFPGTAWSATSWTGWGGLGGLVGSRAGCASQAPSQLVCGVFGIIDSALWVDQYNGSTWSGFGRLGQTTIGNPSCAPLGKGKVLCAVVSVNNKVFSTVGP